MIRKLGPRMPRQFQGAAHRHIAHVDSIEPQERHVRRKGARQVAVVLKMHFLQTRTALQHMLSAHAPVVEIPRHEQRCIGRHLLFDHGTERLQLRHALMLPQTEMHTDRVYVEIEHGGSQHAMQQPASLMAPDGNVDVVVRSDRKLGQQRVAMMSVWVHSIAAVGELGPDGVGQKLVLTVGGPARESPSMAMVRAQHFLQEDDVGVRGANGFAQLMQYEATVEEGKALMGVDRQYPQRAMCVWVLHSGGPLSNNPPLASIVPAAQLSSNASSASCSPRTFSNMCSRSSTRMPRRWSPETSSTTLP